MRTAAFDAMSSPLGLLTAYRKVNNGNRYVNTRHHLGAIQKKRWKLTVDDSDSCAGQNQRQTLGHTTCTNRERLKSAPTKKNEFRRRQENVTSHR